MCEAENRRGQKGDISKIELQEGEDKISTTELLSPEIVEPSTEFVELTAFIGSDIFDG